jgi:hypothetical protein
MSVTATQRSDEIRELEELWERPALPEPQRRPRRYLELAPDTARVPGVLVAGAWIAFFLVVLAFEPTPNPQATTPVWANLIFAGMALSLLTAALLGPLLPRLGFACASVAGCFGMAIAVACHTTAHHPGAWWIGELVATAGLTALAAGGHVERLRRE